MKNDREPSQASVAGGARANAATHTCRGLGALRNSDGMASLSVFRMGMPNLLGGRPNPSACMTHKGQWSILILVDESSGIDFKTRPDGALTLLTHTSIMGSAT